MTAYSDSVVRALEEAAETFSARSAVYKDNVHMVGKVMEALFPDGHTQQDATDHNRWHIFELMIVKITRYVLNYDQGGHEDSLKDLAVYATMLNALDQEMAALAKPEATEKEDPAEQATDLLPEFIPGYGHTRGQRPPTVSQIEYSSEGVSCVGCGMPLVLVNGPTPETERVLVHLATP